MFVLNNMKCVCYRYASALDEGRKLAMKKYYVLAILLSAVFIVLYSAYGLAFWYGSNLIVEGISSPGSIFTVSQKYKMSVIINCVVVIKIIDVNIGILQCNGWSIFHWQRFAIYKFSKRSYWCSINYIWYNW